MLVDSSALAEQVVSDVVASAFDSAGQRCSALRVLCVQDDGADAVDRDAQGRDGREPDRRSGVARGRRRPGHRCGGARRHRAHVEAMRAKGRARRSSRRAARADATARGTFVLPTLIELERLGELEREVFGPVLHVVRYRRADLDALVEQINATGYGLTLGVHSRIDETIARVVAAAHVGNVYVNRNMVGAVVGVQPFGGEGLSGTGPKAGGPLYLYRLLARRPADVMARALGARPRRCAEARSTPAAGGPARWRAAGVGRRARRSLRLTSAARDFAPRRAPARRASCAARPASATSIRCRARSGPLPRRRATPTGCPARRGLAVGSRAVWPTARGRCARGCPRRSDAIPLVDDWTRRGPLRRRPPSRHTRAARAVSRSRRGPGRSSASMARTRAKRRSRRAAGDRARAQRQHRGRGWQRDADDAPATR